MERYRTDYAEDIDTALDYARRHVADYLADEVLAEEPSAGLTRGHVSFAKKITVQGIKTIHVAQSQYYSQHGRWAGSLDELRALLPNDLTSGRAFGYRFRMCTTTTSYAIHADPL